MRNKICEELNKSDIGKVVNLCGWVDRRRDHGGVIFIDLRDHSGFMQITINPEDGETLFKQAEILRNETVIMVNGIVNERPKDSINKNILTGELELKVKDLQILNQIKNNLPFPISVHDYENTKEELRLKYRYLDLRRNKMQKNIKLRHNVINHVRNFMNKEGFMELATPILTAPSPEGARDYLVPSRIHKGSFYALPQAPQQFKQLYIASGIDKYFQIAPCFRDEDSRADRSPGEFYQIDMEMSFATQEDVLDIISRLLFNVFDQFKDNSKTLNSLPFPTLSYKQSMEQFGCDKPDLRNPLRLVNVTKYFEGSGLKIFESLIEKGAIVNCVQALGSEGKPRSFYDNLNKWAIEDQGKKGLGYINFENKEAKGPLAKNFNSEKLKSLLQENNFNQKDGLLFICDMPHDSYDFGSKVITKAGQDLGLIDTNKYEFCWIVDYPMYEKDATTGKIDFSHNPFSMPQGGMGSLEREDPLNVLAYQSVSYTHLTLPTKRIV